MRRAWVYRILVIASLLVPTLAQAQTIKACDPLTTSVGRGGWILDVTYRTSGAPVNDIRQLTLGAPYVPLEGREALVFLIGGVPITDGASSTLLVAEQIQTISCGDTDGDFRIGILRVELLLRNVRTGDLVTAFIVPGDGELDDNEEEEVTIVIGTLTLVGTVERRFFVYGTELPG